MYHAKTSSALQLDGSKLHFKDSINEDIYGELNADGLNIKLEQQSAQ